MELPKYQLPTVKDLALGLFQRAWIFLRRAGTMIFTVAVVLWLLLNFPRAEPGKDQVDASIAGHIANGLAVVVSRSGSTATSPFADPVDGCARSRGQFAGNDICRGQQQRRRCAQSALRPSSSVTGALRQRSRSLPGSYSRHSACRRSR
jgi:hypothetical protein